MRNGPKIYFVGHNMSSTYLNDLIYIIGDQDVSINIISKSGTTTEPTLIFRVLKEYMEKRYPKNQISKRIYVTANKSRGALKFLADKEGYEAFIVPDDIGGRYSVLTAVGLLPMAIAGIDIDQVMKGSRDAMEDLSTVDDNPVLSLIFLRYHHIILDI